MHGYNMDNGQTINKSDICLQVQEINDEEKENREYSQEINVDNVGNRNHTNGPAVNQDAICDSTGAQKPHNFEEVIVAMGPPGRYQYRQCILMSANFSTVVFVVLNFVFIGLEPSFSCSQVNETLLQEDYRSVTNDSTTYQFSYGDCEIQITSNSSRRRKQVDTIGCEEGYNYHGGKHVSIITEWDLVCDSTGIGQIVQTGVALGYFIGLIVSASLSDKFGRKKTIMIAIALSSISEVSSGFAPNIYAIISLRFFSGLFASGICVITVVLAAELLASNHRELNIFFFGIIWCFFSLQLSVAGYLFRNESWRCLQIFLGFCCATPLLFTFFVDESSSWLFSTGKYERAKQNLQRACKLNNVDFNRIDRIWQNLCIQKTSNQQRIEAVAKENKLSTLFRNKKLRIYLFIGWLVFLVNNAAFTGLYLSASTLAGNLYLNTALISLLEIPGCIMLLFMLKYKGRRFVVIFFMAMAAVCLLVSTVLGSGVTENTQHITNTSTAFFLIGRLASSNSFSTLYLYIPELFPTTLRSSGSGLCETGSCVGMMLAPYLVPLHSLLSWAPGAFLAGALAISALLLIKLPETKGKQLASSIEG